jgi:molybdenum cofactor cytidylyltransferase
MIGGIILAAGLSTRMGRDKALLPYRGSTFLGHLIHVLRQPRIGFLRIVVGENAAAVREQITFDPSQIVINPHPEQPQLVSLQLAIRSIPEQLVDGALVCLVDHPCVERETVRLLLDRFYQAGKRIVIPTFHGQRGHPVLFAVSLFGELLAAPLEQGARAVVHKFSADVLEVPTEDEGIVLDIDDPEAYRRITSASS